MATWRHHHHDWVHPVLRDIFIFFVVVVVVEQKFNQLILDKQNHQSFLFH